MKPRRFFLLLTIIMLLGALGLLVVTQRPALVDARNAADASFTRLSPSLEARYKTVPAILEALKTSGAQDRGPSIALAKAESAWLIALNGESANQISDAANSIEGNVARVRAMYQGSDRLREYKAQMDPALAAYDQSLSADTKVKVKENAEAVAAYRAKRGAWLSKPVVFIGGFDERITYEPVSDSAASKELSTPEQP
ncbi:hypothetical protein IMCC26256_11743 [Actinobacteria bacterium IMCC26256]|nr:hypothetical protein IMCC26256_11743 [Actinobacteria bacterium IMCC26256]